MSWRLRSPTYLRAAYPLNNHAQDVSGYGNHGTWAGTTAYAAFLKNSLSAGDFNGANSYVELPFVAGSHMNGQTAFSIAFWFLADALQGTLFNFRDGIGDGITIDHLDAVAFRVNAVVSSSPSIPIGTWTHVVAVKRAAGTQALYINGILVDTDDSSAEVIAVAANPRIGIDYDLSGDLNGRIAGVRLYACSLTGDEVLTLYHMPQPTY